MRDWLESLKWDSKPRLDTWLQSHWPPAAQPADRLIYCPKCGCHYLNVCPKHPPEEGGPKGDS